MQTLKVYWANGSKVTVDEALDVLMWYYGENLEDAKFDLFCINREKLQKAVDCYARQH